MTHIRGRSPAMSAEAELIFGCARVRMDAAAASRIQEALKGNIDWDYLLETGRRHGMMPLLCQHLSALGEQTVPGDVMKLLHKRFEDNVRRNLLLTGELLRILKMFASKGISAIPYKGPSLAAQLYGNLALRQFCDLDILVRRRDVTEAKRALSDDGYRAQLEMTDAQERAYFRFECDQHFAHRDSHIMVELHWDIAPPFFSFRFDPERIWERLEYTELAGVQVPTPAPEELLLILCAHGTKHLWERLEWIVGIGELARAEGRLDWKRVERLAIESGCERILLLGLLLAHDLLDVPLPADILLKAQRDTAAQSLASEVRQNLFQENVATPPSVFDLARFHLKAREGLSDKAQYLLRRTLTPTHKDWEFFPLPTYLLALYYLLRPIRLFGEYGSHRFRRLAMILGSR